VTERFLTRFISFNGKKNEFSVSIGSHIQWQNTVSILCVYDNRKASKKERFMAVPFGKSSKRVAIKKKYFESLYIDHDVFKIPLENEKENNVSN